MHQNKSPCIISSHQIFITFLHIIFSRKNKPQALSKDFTITKTIFIVPTLRCVIPVVCVTNEREENAVKQYN